MSPCIGDGQVKSQSLKSASKDIVLIAKEDYEKPCRTLHCPARLLVAEWQEAVQDTSLSCTAS